MMSCWSKEPTERPNFQYLEETLRKLRDYEEDKRANQNGAEGHVNQAYQEDGVILYQYKYQYNQKILALFRHIKRNKCYESDSFVHLTHYMYLLLIFSRGGGLHWCR